MIFPNYVQFLLSNDCYIALCALTGDLLQSVTTWGKICFKIRPALVSG